MKQEPTLMMGDLPLNFDYSILDTFVCATFPHPIRFRDSSTKDGTKNNRFYQYASFEEAREAWKLINGTELPSVWPGFVVDLTFTLQENEHCVFFSAHSLKLNRYEIYTIFTRYQSILGVAHYRFVEQGNKCQTSCIVRFSDKEDCMQAATELNKAPFEGSCFHVTIAVRDIDILIDYVSQRESLKSTVGIPAYHNIYEKRQVTQEEFNDLTISAPSFFDDLEGSRWSDIVLHGNVQESHYARQVALCYYENF